MSAAGAGSLLLVGGGARSGKSRFALVRARELGRRRAYVATAQPEDEEMKARIARHIAERGNDFATLEAPFDLAESLTALADTDVVVLDCLTLWMANLLAAGQGEEEILRRLEQVLDLLRRAPFASIVVTNEVGMGIVPDHRLGRVFRDLAGRAHQRVAGVADEIYLAVLGVVVRLKPGPVATVDGPTERR